MTIMSKEYFAQLFEEAEIALLETGDRYAYEQRIKQLRDLHNTHEYKYEQGLEKGREEGRKENMLLVAAKMKSEGCSVQLIEKCTGLSPEDIEKA